jgi:hypothetical protein
MFAANPLRRSAAAGIFVSLLAVASPAQAEDPTSLGDAMLGISSAVCTLVYTPVKMVYAAAGVGVGSLVWLFSAGNTEAMNTVLKITAGGDYTVTPEHLRGIRVLKFTGRSKRT